MPDELTPGDFRATAAKLRSAAKALERFADALETGNERLVRVAAGTLQAAMNDAGDATGTLQTRWAAIMAQAPE